MYILYGIIALFIAAISWSIGSLLSKNKIVLPDNILLSTGMWLFMGGLLSLGVATILGEFNTLLFNPITTGSLMAQIYLSTVASGGLVGFFWILKKTTPTLANTFAYVSPVAAIFFAWILLDESIDIRIIISTIVILVGVIIIVNKNKIDNKVAIK